tara:strand:+ start:154 stop:507 length:354 start_codon:yes stop_codon:yes gene_type:complete
MEIILIFLLTLLILMVYKNINSKKIKNIKLDKFKNKFLSKESNIERIFLRNDEKTSSDPNINIEIGLNENEVNIKRKSNLHRSRLSKFKKSMLNGEMIYLDEEEKIYKYFEGKRIYL